MTKYLLIIIVLLVSMSSSAALISEEDKRIHFVLNTAMTTTAYIYLRAKKHSKFTSIMGAIGTSIFVSVAKEVSDDVITSRDLTADGAGILAGAMIGLTFDF